MKIPENRINLEEINREYNANLELKMKHGPEYKKPSFDSTLVKVIAPVYGEIKFIQDVNKTDNSRSVKNMMIGAFILGKCMLYTQTFKLYQLGAFDSLKKLISE